MVNAAVPSPFFRDPSLTHTAVPALRCIAMCVPLSSHVRCCTAHLASSGRFMIDGASVVSGVAWGVVTERDDDVTVMRESDGKRRIEILVADSGMVVNVDG